MGFMNKIKNILFEEEEIIEEPVKEEKVEIKKPKIEIEKDDDFEISKPKKEDDSLSKLDELSDREIFKSEPTFKFPAFDEEEFEQTMPKPKAPERVERKEVLERPSRTEYSYEPRNSAVRNREPKRTVYSPYERVVEEPKDRKKFKPSPIISPVYGVLDKNYTPEDIIPKKKEDDIERKGSLDVDSVRKKAFGVLEETEPTVTYYEETTVVADPETLKKELESRVKTIDELLEESATEEIPVVDEAKKVDAIEEELDNVSEELEVLDKEIKEPQLEEDTVESDLFDLIDSMYESGEEE